MKYLLIIQLLFVSIANGQSVTFREIKLKPNAEFQNTTEKTIIFPIVITHNLHVDKLINLQIKAGTLNLETENQNLKGALMNQINQGLINSSYEVTYKRNGFLSFNIYMEGCGAHCSSWTTYFNFNLMTGKKITLSDLMFENKIDSFKNIVYADKIKSLQNYKIEEIESLKNQYIDSVSYNWILDEVDNNCMKEITTDQFSMSNVGIEIFDVCEFPFAIKSQEPNYELKYSYPFIRKFLKPKFRRL